MITHSKHSLPKYGRAIIVSTMLLGGIFRLLGIWKGLPYIYYPDEPVSIGIVQNIFKTGNLNPHFFNYPSLFYYLNALAYIPYYIIGVMRSTLTSLSDVVAADGIVMGVGITSLPSTFLLGRGITAFWGIFAIGILFIIGWKITNDWRAGLFSALLLAVSPTHIEYSRYMYPHVIFVTFILLAFWFDYKILVRGYRNDYLLAGLFSGLAISTMYYGVVILFTLISAHFLRTGGKGLRDRKFYISIGLSIFVFFVLNPFALFTPNSFAQDSTSIIRHYLFAVGDNKVAGLGNAPVYYFKYAWNFEGPFFVLATIGLFRALISRHKPGLLVASFSLPYFILISSATARNPRTFLPLIPFSILMSVMLFAYLADLIQRSHSLSPTAIKTCLLGILFLLLVSLVPVTVRSIHSTSILCTKDSRETARVWIAKHIPKGSKIALESYSAYVDPQIYSVQGIIRLIDNPPEWYISNGFGYLVFGQGMYGRFYAEPDTYTTEVARYEELFASFKKVKIFRDGRYEIRIYRIIQ